MRYFGSMITIYISFFELSQIAPELLDLSENKEHPRSLSSTIHRVRSIVSKWKETEQNQDIQSKPCGLLRITPAQSFHTQPPYKPGLCCAPAFHPYLWLGQENPQHQPSTSLHMAVLNSNPDLKDVPHNQPLNNPILSPKEHTLQRLATITQELGKYFPIEKPTVKKVESYIEENEPSSMWSATVEAEVSGLHLSTQYLNSLLFFFHMIRFLTKVLLGGLLLSAFNDQCGCGSLGDDPYNCAQLISRFC